MIDLYCNSNQLFIPCLTSLKQIVRHVIFSELLDWKSSLNIVNNKHTAHLYLLVRLCFLRMIKDWETMSYS